MRIIPVKVLTSNLMRIFSLYKKYSNDEYNNDLFKKADEEIDLEDKDEQKYEFIIENGFHIYTLIKLYITNKVFEEL